MAYPELANIRRNLNKNKWNFTFITGDKKLCPNVIERLNLFNDKSNKDGSTIKVLIGSDVLSECVDIMNVRQLHVLTPHWNYEKLNQIVGRIRRVNSHSALPQKHRNVNVYLHMAYDPSIPCSNSINYSIDYYKYVKCEDKYNQSLSYYKALKNASMENLVFNKLPINYTSNSVEYSSLYLKRKIPIFLSLICNYLKTIFNNS
ncbi:hypothetical protein BCR36DRAFT_463184 [Piromyces finnis]|uniref:Helicase C-terminal domain-containing protein n=1 Tax=Piromyces finnis TaxID=1754191 RepID=A0A1Y1UX75_9FUNG|nr:hypothetical protein BCR36DRAFT_463184 [Piromyces finnis]|eukprot:ORX42671.1 hypothetical protein BCR36DRAFT_463184 [Piromyces finnis]